MNNLSASTQDFTKEFWNYISKAKKVALTTHLRPDDDSVSSVLATYELIKTAHPDKQVEIFTDSPRKENYEFLKNYDKFNFEVDFGTVYKNFDLLIFTDNSQYHMFTEQKDIDFSTVKSICIDHHPNEHGEFSLLYSDTTKSSNAEILFDLFFKGTDFSKEIAETLLLGILGDTGGLRFIPPNRVSCLAAVSEILVKGDLDLQTFSAKAFQYSKEIFEITQELMKNTTFEEVPGWPHFQFSYLSKEFAEKYSDQDLHNAGSIYFFNNALKTQGYTWAVILKYFQGKVNVNLRSLPESVNVSDLAKRLSGGGGHVRAAGARLEREGHDLDVVEAKSVFMDWLSKNKPEIV